MAAINVNNARAIFEKHMPEASVDYCYQLWQEFNFNFKISRKRNSKLGDYKFDPRSGEHSISVNENLNVYSFLITYVHEVAHLIVQLKYKGRVQAHGREWKSAFKKLMYALLNDKVFPSDLLGVLAQHMKNPKASSTSDRSLQLALNAYDPPSNEILLKDLDQGDKFLFNKRTFQKIELRRTRSLCLCLDNSRKYLISDTAAVKKFKHA